MPSHEEDAQVAAAQGEHGQQVRAVGERFENRGVIEVTDATKLQRFLVDRRRRDCVQVGGQAQLDAATNVLERRATRLGLRAAPLYLVRT
jgi:hypothetical protein